MDLSVIIVNYNVRQFLENALLSIQRAMADVEGEIFVVDNASEDGSVEMVRNRFPDVQLIENRVNQGFARANNIALRMASGRFILLINPDVIVQEDTFRVMMDFFERHPRAGMAGCKVLNPDGSFQLACRRSIPTPWVAFTRIVGLSALFPESRIFGRYNLKYLDPDAMHEVEAISGSFMMIRRDVYEAVGGLDERFFMYGEDIDWCYRVGKAGYTIHYVPGTQIIHFKGESTRRSEIDEIKTFYHAMQLFVEKHFSTSVLGEVFLTLGILLRAGVAFAARAIRTVALAAIDVILTGIAFFVGEWIYFGAPFHFPGHAYPAVYVVPALILVSTMYFMGVYTTHRHSLSRAASSVVGTFVIISALVFFAKDFAFSRAVVLIAGGLCLGMIPGWRLLLMSLGYRSGSVARRSLFGRRTVIVGTGPSAREILRKLRARVDDGYDVLGFIDLSRMTIGDKIAGLEVIGSIDNVGKVIREHRVGEVIFSTDGLSYTEILSVISRGDHRNVNFRLVPNSIEAIIGKTRIDQLDDLPLVEIEYNIHRPLNRFTKRSFDLIVAAVLLLVLSPVLLLGKLPGWGTKGRIVSWIFRLPSVVKGDLSLVGRPSDGEESSLGKETTYLGPHGLTGLVQINRRSDLTSEEAERYMLYYAKNQSLLLDLEIILKSLQVVVQKRKD